MLRSSSSQGGCAAIKVRVSAVCGYGALWPPLPLPLPRILPFTAAHSFRHNSAHPQVIGLELYDDECEGRPRDAVCRAQWLETGSTSLVGKRILVVDEVTACLPLWQQRGDGMVRHAQEGPVELAQQRQRPGLPPAAWLPPSSPHLACPRPQVDDSRQTLAYAVRELRADIAAEEAALAAAGQPVPPTQLATFVVHCKARAKAGELPADVPQFVGEQVDGDAWIMYAWDAACIDTHNRSAIGEL